MKKLLSLMLIISHLLINVAWASSHMVEDFVQHAHESPHVHLSTLLSFFDGNDDVPHEHENEAHVHLILYVSGIEHFAISATPGQNSSDIEIPFTNIAASPPVPPPTA